MRRKKHINSCSVIKYYFYLIHLTFTSVYFTFHYMCFAKIVFHQRSLCTGLDKVLKKYHPKCLSVRDKIEICHLALNNLPPWPLIYAFYKLYKFGKFEIKMCRRQF